MASRLLNLEHWHERTIPRFLVLLLFAPILASLLAMIGDGLWLIVKPMFWRVYWPENEVYSFAGLVILLFALPVGLIYFYVLFGFSAAVVGVYAAVRGTFRPTLTTLEVMAVAAWTGASFTTPQAMKAFTNIKRPEIAPDYTMVMFEASVAMALTAGICWRLATRER